MNGIPMRFDYSKTINEQLSTFEYYKNRYCSYELKNMELQQENQQLKIQISAREENYRKLEDNWKKLKEYIEQEISIPMGGREFCCYSNVKDKIKELERGESNVKD